MATASELISNQGNPDLGLGSNPNIPVATNTDMDLLAQVGNSIMLQNMQQNRHLFDQKIKDRDDLMRNISSGDIKVGDLLEEDMPYVTEGLDDLDTAWEKMVAKGRNDLKAQQTYRKALREATDRVTQAQGRKVFYDGESVALSKETLPRKQEARRQNLEKSIKGGFWKDLMPYQQSQDLDIDKHILSAAKTVSTQYSNPAAFEKGVKTLFDWEKTLDATDDNYRNNVDARQSQQLLLREMEMLSPQELTRSVNAINNRIREYNDFKGLNPNDVGYVQDVNLVNDAAAGRIRIADPVSQFAAKYALSRQKPFGSTTSEFDQGRFKLLQEAERERHNRAMEGIARGNLAVKWKQYDLASQKAGVSDQMAKSAKAYAKALMEKLNGMKNADGIIPSDKLRTLTSDELKYLGTAVTSQNKFTLNPLNLKPDKEGKTTNLIVEDDGTVKVYSGGTKNSLGRHAGSLNVTTIATNKLGDEMTLTSGKEGFNFNNLMSLYGPDAGGAEQPEDEEGDEENPENWTQEGKNWRYKDGTLYDAKGNVISEQKK